MAMQRIIFATSAGFSDRSECDIDSLIVLQRRSAISGNIFRHMVHQFSETSRMMSSSRAPGSIAVRACVNALFLLYRSREIWGGSSLRVSTALSNKLRAGASSRRPAGKGSEISAGGRIDVFRRLLRTSAAAGTRSAWRIHVESSLCFALPV